MQRVEPAAGLVDPLADEVGGEPLLEQVLVLEGVVVLRPRHRARVEPGVDHREDAPHRPVTVLALARPRYFIPIHGEYRQLAGHARVAALVTGGLPRRVEVLTAENGDVLRFDQDGGRLLDKVPAGRVLIDGTRVGEVGDEVLRDRRHLAADGLVVPVVAINRQTGSVDDLPEIIARGFVTDRESDDVLAEGARLIAMVIAESSVEEKTDPGLIQEKIRGELRRFLRKRTGRRPMVLPVVMEI